jgi:hypothetical protein
MGARPTYLRILATCIISLSALPFGLEARAEAGAVVERVAAQSACPAPSIWDERFQYADELARSENFTKAKSVLEAALNDCDASVRQRALVMLAAIAAEEDPEEWRSKLWRWLRTRLSESIEIAVKGALVLFVGSVIIGLVVGAVSKVARYCNRNRIIIRPLTMSGGGDFDGQHFVAIAAAMHHKMRALRRGAALPAVSRAGPRMVMERVTSAVAEAVVAAASDKAGKLGEALTRIFERPEYICYGSAHCAGRSISIVVRLERGDQIVAVWEKSSSPGRLIEDLKDLTFLVLQAAMAEIRSGWN